MNGILLITHFEMAQAFLKTITHILGSLPPNVDFVELKPDCIPHHLLDETLHKIKIMQTNGVNGVLVLTDIFGASPCNLANLLLKENNVEVLSGLNLGMLLRAVGYRHLDLQQMCQKAQNGALESVMNVRDFLNKG